MGGDQLSRCAARPAMGAGLGVGEVEVDGAVLCRPGLGQLSAVLEAVRGYEVMSLKSMFTKGEGERADS